MGDGVLALFGLDKNPATACGQAIQAIAKIAANVEQLNRDLASDLREPIGFGIGVNGGKVIIGVSGGDKPTRGQFVAVDAPFANKLMIHVLSAVAEWEREQISERTRAALAAAKALRTKSRRPFLACANTVRTPAWSKKFSGAF